MTPVSRAHLGRLSVPFVLFLLSFASAAEPPKQGVEIALAERAVLHSDRAWLYYSLGFSNDGKILAATGYEGVDAGLFRVKRPAKLQLFEVDNPSREPKVVTGEDRDEFRVVGTAAGSLGAMTGKPVFSEAGEVLIARWNAVAPKEITIFGATTGDVLRSFDYGSEMPVTAAALSPDRTTLAIAAGGRKAGRRSHFYPDSKQASPWQGEVSLWDVGTGQARTRFRWEEGKFFALAFAPDGRTLVAGGGYPCRLTSGTPWFMGGLYQRDTASGNAIFDVELEKHEILCLAFMSDGASLITGGLDGTLRWWDLSSGRVTESLEMLKSPGKFPARVQTMALCPGENVLAVSVGIWNRAGNWGELRLLDLATKQVGAVVFEDIPDIVACLAFSPDGKMLAAGTVDGVLKLWDLQVTPKAPPASRP